MLLGGEVALPDWLLCHPSLDDVFCVHLLTDSLVAGSVYLAVTLAEEEHSIVLWLIETSDGLEPSPLPLAHASLASDVVHADLVAKECAMLHKLELAVHVVEYLIRLAVHRVNFITNVVLLAEILELC